MGDAGEDSIEAWLESRPSDGGGYGRLRCGTCVGEWHVEAYLGAGVSSEVYRVRHLNLSYEGALKLLVNDAKNLKERFLAEIDAIRFLSLPSLPRFFGAGTFGAMPFYVMEYLLPLPDPMPRGDVPGFLNKVAKAVQTLHEAGFVHRDLKPGNIMLRRNGDPVLIDLGLVKPRGNAHTPLGWKPSRVSMVDGKPVGVGTLSFAAPEQLLEGKKVQFGELGTFYLSVKSSGADDEEKFNLGTDIKGLYLRFQPSRRDVNDLSSKTLKKKAVFMNVKDLVGETTEA